MTHQHLATRRKSRRGNSLIEFSLLGVPMLLSAVAIVMISIAMWQYHCLAYASETTASYASVHGATCSQNGNTCSLTVGNLATYFAAQAIALPNTQVTVNFKDGSGTTTCSPLNTCSSSSAVFPSPSYNSVGKDVTVSATYTLINPVALLWPIGAARNFTVGATSRQRILF